MIVGCFLADETTVVMARFGTEANATEHTEFHGQSTEAQSPRACGYSIDVM
jgi:hypothetical protein